MLAGAHWTLDVSLREKSKHQYDIKFTGPAFGDRKAELLSDSDVLVALSTAPESFDIVITEAYFYGLPVIATWVGAYSEIIKDGETGLLVKPGSVEGLSSAFIRICAEKNFVMALSRSSFEEAQKFTTGKFLGDQLNLYEDKE